MTNKIQIKNIKIYIRYNRNKKQNDIAIFKELSNKHKDISDNLTDLICFMILFMID